MINALAVSSNISFIQKLLHEINKRNLNVKVVEIAGTKEETKNLTKVSNFDIIFLDKDVKRNYNEVFFRKYEEIIVSLSYSSTANLINESVLKEISNLINRSDLEKRREKIIQELEYVGYKFKYKGTHYLVDTILQMYSKQNSMTDNLQSDIYPIIAKKYNKSINNIKSSINKATEAMYCECNGSKIEKYFHFSHDVKPTVKQVVFTVINKI